MFRYISVVAFYALRALTRPYDTVEAWQIKRDLPPALRNAVEKRYERIRIPAFIFLMIVGVLLIIAGVYLEMTFGAIVGLSVIAIGAFPVRELKKRHEKTLEEILVGRWEEYFMFDDNEVYQAIMAPRLAARFRDEHRSEFMDSATWATFQLYLAGAASLRGRFDQLALKVPTGSAKYIALERSYKSQLINLAEVFAKLASEDMGVDFGTHFEEQRVALAS